MSFLSPETWSQAERAPEFVSDPDCRHRTGIFIDMASVDGATVVAFRCDRCGEILSTGSDG